MKKHDTKERIPDCWHVAHLDEIVLLGYKLHDMSMSKCILETWHQAHSYKQQLIEAKETIRKRNLMIKQLRDKIDNMETQIDDDPLNA